MKRLAAKLSIALLATLLTLEVCLQLAAWLARSDGPPVSGPDGDEIVILCVGDSHTWGAGVSPEDNYPSQLGAALEVRFPSQRFRIFNLGLPGVNSAHVANRLETQLLALRPAIVIVWVGTNNMWNELEQEDSTGGGLHQALLRSKLYRLATVLWHTRSGAFESLGQDGQEDARRDAFLAWTSAGQQRSAERIDETLAADMQRMVETANTLGTEIVFLSYPQERQQLPVSDFIARNARALGVPVVVTAHDRERAEADGLREGQLFVFSAGPHPSPALYGYIVESLLATLVDSLDLAPER